MKIALGLPCLGSPGTETILRRHLCPEGAFLCRLARRTSFWKRNLDKSQNPKLQRDGQLGFWAAFQPRRQTLPFRAPHGLERDSWPVVPWLGGTQEAKFTIHAPLLLEKA